MREELKNYRDMVYVQNLNDSEFEVFFGRCGRMP